MAIIPRSPPLRLKVLVILGGGMLLLLGGTIIGLFFLMRHDFNRLARELAEQRVERVVNSFATRAEALHASVADNAVWDETYDFVRGMSGREYLSRNYYNAASVDESYDFVLVFGARNEFLGGVTHHGDGFQETPPPGLDPAELGRSRLMVGTSRDADGATGIIRVGESVALVAAHAVKPTSDEGDPAGTLVYGATLAGKLLSDLQSTTGVAVTPLPAGARPPISGLHAVPILPPGDTLEKFSVRLEDNWNDPAGPTAWLEGVGLDGQPILFKLHFAPARFADVARRPLIIIALVAGAGVLLLAIVLSLVEFSVLRAVASLDRQMAAFAQNPTAGGTITIGGSQEFSRLAASANEMLEAFRDQSEELDSERELLRSVLDAAAEGLLAFCAKRDSDGRIVDFMLARANPAGLRLLPVPESEVPGWSLREALEGVGGDEPLWRSFVQVAETGVPEHVITPSRLNPENRWLDRQLSPWGDGVVLSVSDVTEQRESEQQLRASLAEIERFNRAMLDREERVLELKREINDLATTRGEAIRYHSVT